MPSTAQPSSTSAFYHEGEGEDTGLELARVGPYEIVAPVGRGGFGVVYKAVDRSRDHTVAIKVLYPRYDADRRRRRRNYLEDEIRAVGQLRHKNVVRMLDRVIEQQDSEGNARRCLIMEYVDGHNLRKHIHDRDLSLRQSLDLARELCLGLDYLHQNGVVHRDVKPENFLMSRDGRHVKIVDFGLSEVHTGWWHWLPWGRKGGGTQPYMSPEQLSHGPIDARSDIFSLGITLYELFTGRHPCPGPRREDIIKQLRSRRFRFVPPSKYNPEIPPQLDRVVLRALRRNPEHRYQSVTEMLMDLERVRESRI